MKELIKNNNRDSLILPTSPSLTNSIDVTMEQNSTLNILHEHPCEPDASSESRSEAENEHSSDSDSSTENRTEDYSLRLKLAEWSAENGVTQTATTNLLHILKEYHPDLPKDCRTLLGSNIEIHPTQIQGGFYYHLGLENGILFQLSMFPQLVSKIIKIQINIDGLPIHKSNNSQFWPILGMIENKKENIQMNKTPFVIGIFHGMQKPKDLEEFLRPFVDEAKKLLQNGLSYSNCHCKFVISMFICDTPARAQIKNVKPHNAYHGCDQCYSSGTYIENPDGKKGGKVVFKDIDMPLRRNSDFEVEAEEDEHRKGETPLTELGVGMVTDFPVDYMHSVCLGVTRKLVWLWRKGPLKTRIGCGTTQRISMTLQSLSGFITCEFNRKPRGLDESDRWKATECRTFLCYTGIVVLQNKGISQRIYRNFMLLACAIRIMSSPNTCEELSDYAHSLMTLFIQQFESIYGESQMTYNVHSLIHLSNQVKKYGPLENASAFPFENYLGKIKRMLRKPSNPLKQVARRLYEEQSISRPPGKPVEILQKKHFCDTVPQNIKIKSQFKEAHLTGYTIKTSAPNNCVQLKNGIVGIVRNIILSVDDSILCVYRKYSKHENLFDYPTPSKNLDIFIVSKLKKTDDICRLSDIDKKCILLTIDGVEVSLPLLNCC